MLCKCSINFLSFNLRAYYFLAHRLFTDVMRIMIYSNPLRTLENSLQKYRILRINYCQILAITICFYSPSLCFLEVMMRSSQPHSIEHLFYYLSYQPPPYRWYYYGNACSFSREIESNWLLIVQSSALVDRCSLATHPPWNLCASFLVMIRQLCSLTCEEAIIWLLSVVSLWFYLFESD